MAQKWKSAIAAMLVVTTMHLGIVSSAHAVIVETEAVHTAIEKQTASEIGRTRLAHLLERPDVVKELARLGFDREEALARVNAMTDEEVAIAAKKLDQLPAGADGLGTFLGIALFVFIVLLITDILGLTKIFPFTRSVR